VQLSGLDLSPEMLANCQRNLRRWDLEADLYLGNAESLPFADESFDVVFHVGGINFFNDRAKAIREMIRVAKPGSLLLISDETEKHVKGVYEKQPGGLFKNRKEPVSPPVDLVPPRDDGGSSRGVERRRHLCAHVSQACCACRPSAQGNASHRVHSVRPRSCCSLTARLPDDLDGQTEGQSRRVSVGVRGFR